MTIFDWLKQITGEKRKWELFTEVEKESFNPYMTHRFISMYEGYIDIANYIQTIPYTEKEKIYKIYCDMIPKKKCFFKIC